MKFCRWTLFKIYEELKDISEENKQSFDSKSRTLTHLVAFEEVYGRLSVSCWRCTHCNSSRVLHEENQLRFIQQQYKRFRFYWTKKHFISEWYFANYKTMRLGVLWWEKLKNRESQGRIVPWAWTSLGVEEQLLIFPLCLSPGWVKNLQMFINVCLKVDHSANLNHSKSTWRQPIVL